MKYIVLAMWLFALGLADNVKVPIKEIDEVKKEATVKVDEIDVGVSGYIVHNIGANHTIILNSARVKEFDANTKTAKVELGEFSMLDTKSLPHGKWSATKGDDVVFAFNYNRAILIAPNEEIYHRVTKSSSVEWIHPDIFATHLSVKGHPTPLKADFSEFCQSTSVGIIFIYLEGKVFTLDAGSFKILAITDAKLEQKELKLPFYTRVEEINAAWWGEGSSRLKEYEAYYYKLLVDANKDDKKLYEIIKNSNKKVKYLLSEFDFEGKRDVRKKLFGLF